MNNLCMFCKEPLLKTFLPGERISLRARICEPCWIVMDKSPAANLLNIELTPTITGREVPHF